MKSSPAPSTAKLALVTEAATEAASAVRMRDAAIRVAHQDGATLRAIAAASGLSFQRVHQIVRA